MKLLVLGLFLMSTVTSAVADDAFSLDVVKVADKVYALVGDTGPRSEKNHGLNNTLGFIETDTQIILISSGTNAEATEMIEKAIRSISPKPVTFVINIGVQDHHWMGNHYFAAEGAKVIALKKTVAEQRANLDSQIVRLERAIKDQIKTVKPQYATEIFDSGQQLIDIDGLKMELIWPGEGHFAGDAILWLPQQKIIFTGDLVFIDRMLSIHPTSEVAAWQKSFHVMAALNPEFIIPGHGRPTDLAGAKRDTGDYLDWLTREVGTAIGDWKEMDETIDSLSDVPAFKHLQNYESLHRRNIHQTYLQLEATQ